MPKCINVQGVKKRICLGTISGSGVLVDILARDQTFGNDDSIVDYDIDRTTVTTLKAMVETTSGVENFNGINIAERPTHKVTIRFTAGIDISNQVRVNGKTLRIVGIENLEERNENLILFCSERGEEAAAASFS